MLIVNFPLSLGVVCCAVTAEAENKGEVQEAKGNNAQELFPASFPGQMGGNRQDYNEEVCNCFKKIPMISPRIPQLPRPLVG